jgi:hypothetical protein
MTGASDTQGKRGFEQGFVFLRTTDGSEEEFHGFEGGMSHAAGAPLLQKAWVGLKREAEAGEGAPVGLHLDRGRDFDEFAPAAGYLRRLDDEFAV